MAMSTAHPARAGSRNDAPRWQTRPVGFWRAPFAARTWAETLHLLLSSVIGLGAAVFLGVTLAVGFVLFFTFVGLFLAVVALAVGRELAAVERGRARVLLGVAVTAPERRPMRPGLTGLLRAVLLDAVAWRSLLYFCLLAVIGLTGLVFVLVFWGAGLSLVTYPAWFGAVEGDPLTMGSIRIDTPVEIVLAALIGLVICFLAPWPIRGVAMVERLLVRGLLGPVSLSERVRDLEESRAGAVDADAADRRRIERDLHDGAQAQLVALAMELGSAKSKLAAEGNVEAAALVGSAHDKAKTAISDLRNLARGIHPAVLTDRGLDPALSALAAKSLVPVTLDIDVPVRLPSRVEAVAYFIVAESLTNVAKHSGATTAHVLVKVQDDRLGVVISDDGRGGAEVRPSGGLAGLAERARSVDGHLEVASAVGGPTTVYASLPCAS